MFRIYIYHEAGHAIACFAFKVQIICCSIANNEGRSPEGEVLWYNPQAYEDNHSPEVEAARINEIVILLAGKVAQRRFAPDYSEAAFKDALQYDQDRIKSVLACLDGSDATKRVTLAACEERAAALIDLWWPKLESLAQALLSRGGTMSGADITALLSQPCA